jgi:hypothetical protein
LAGHGWLLGSAREREEGRGREERAGRACWAAERSGPRRKEIPFFFFFQFFKANFQKIFKSKFEFDQTTHLKNLNATA